MHVSPLISPHILSDVPPNFYPRNPGLHCYVNVSSNVSVLACASGLHASASIITIYCLLLGRPISFKLKSALGGDNKDIHVALQIQRKQQTPTEIVVDMLERQCRYCHCPHHHGRPIRTHRCLGGLSQSFTISLSTDLATLVLETV